MYKRLQMALLAVVVTAAVVLTAGSVRYGLQGGTGGFAGLRVSAKAVAVVPQQEGGADRVTVSARARVGTAAQVGAEAWQGGAWVTVIDTTGQAAAVRNNQQAHLDTLMANGDTVTVRGHVYVAGSLVISDTVQVVVNVPDVVAPALTSFGIASWDSLGDGGALRVAVTAGANEPCDYAIGFGKTLAEAIAADPVLVTAAADTLDETVDTGIAPYGGPHGEPLYASVVAIDLAGNEGSGASAWIAVYQDEAITPPDILAFDFTYHVDGDDITFTSYGTASIEHFFVEQELRYWVADPGSWSAEWGSGGTTETAFSTLDGPTWTVNVLEEGLAAIMVLDADSVAVRTRIGDLQENWSEWVYVQRLYEDFAAVMNFAYTINGGSMEITANVPPSDYGYQIVVDYSSSYEYLFGGDLQYDYKTRAAGSYSEIFPGAAVTELTLEIPDGVYHSDTLTVYVDELDLEGKVVGSPVEIYSGVINMPLGDVPAVAHGDYRLGATILGNMYSYANPNTFGLTFGDLAKTDLLITNGDAITGTYNYANPSNAGGAWRNWLHDVRDVEDSMAKVAIGFSDVVFWENPDLPFKRRLYHRINNMYLAAFEEGGTEADSNVWVHTVDGEVAWPIAAPNYTYPRRLLNITYAPARAEAIKGFVEEWNHGDNRLPLTGWLFDVWENHADQPIWYDGALAAATGVVDYNLNGTAAVEDDVDMRALREARRLWFEELRAAVYATTDSLDARYFLLGANSNSAASDAALAAQYDFIYLEDFITPAASGNGYFYRTGSSGNRYNAIFPYHFSMDPNYTVVFDQDFWGSRWNVLFEEDLPDPSDYRPCFLNLPTVMRTDAGGPWIIPTSNGNASSSDNAPAGRVAAQDPEYNEVFSLLTDHVYASYNHFAIQHDHEPIPRWLLRQWDHPDQYGRTSLRTLGSPLGAAVPDTIDDHTIVWTREFDNGTVQIAIADTSTFDGHGDGLHVADKFEYLVTLTSEGVEARKSDGWGSGIALEFVSAFADSAYVELTSQDEVVVYVFATAADAPFGVEVGWRHYTDGAWVPASWDDVEHTGLSSIDTEFFHQFPTGIATDELVSGVDSLAARVRVNPDTSDARAWLWSEWVEDQVLYVREQPTAYSIDLAGYSIDEADSVRVYADVSVSPNAPFCVAYQVYDGPESTPICTSATDSLYVFWDQIDSHENLGGQTVYIYVYNAADSLVASDDFVVEGSGGPGAPGDFTSTVYPGTPPVPPPGQPGDFSSTVMPAALPD